MKKIFAVLCLMLTTITALALVPVKTTTSHITPVTAQTEQVFSENNLNIALTPDRATFTLKLKSNSSTGFSWFLREYDSNIVQPISHRYANGENNLIGSSGYEYWTFKIKPGAFIVPQQTLMRMVYSQPFQGDNSTQLAFRISLKGN